jgi:hypothetical protein
VAGQLDRISESDTEKFRVNVESVRKESTFIDLLLNWYQAQVESLIVEATQGFKARIKTN